MVHIFFLCAYFTLHVGIVYCQMQDFYYNDNNHMVIGNLRRREVIPLNPYFSPYSRRKYGADAQTNLNYRRTKEIRDKEEAIDRRFELSEAQLREEKMNNIDNLDNLHNELRWLNLDDEDGIGHYRRILEVNRHHKSSQRQSGSQVGPVNAFDFISIEETEY